jgi:hypothetical protein
VGGGRESFGKHDASDTNRKRDGHGPACDKGDPYALGYSGPLGLIFLGPAFGGDDGFKAVSRMPERNQH